MCKTLEKNYIWILIFSFTVIYIYSSKVDDIFIAFSNELLYNLKPYINIEYFKYFIWLAFIASFGLPISLWENKKIERIKYFKNKRFEIRKQREKEFKSDLFGYKKINKILAPKNIQ